VVFDALVENRVEWPETPVFGEGRGGWEKP
jgi:hypothetical protein